MRFQQYRRSVPCLRGTSLLAMFAVLVLPSTGWGADIVPQKLDTALKGRLSSPNRAGNVEVIVRLTGALTPAQSKRLAKLHANVTRDLSFIRSVALTIPSRNLAKLAKLSFVEHVSYDGQVHKNDAFTVGGSVTDQAWGYNGKNSGSGVTIAVIDSGIARHRDFSGDAFSHSSSRVLESVNFCKSTQSSDDQCGHGTHVAGIAAGNGSSSLQGLWLHSAVYGIARSAKIVSVKVLDKTGAGSVSDVVAGVQWVVSHRSAFNIRVINLSLGHPVGESYRTDPLCLAVEAAWKSGIVVVCAAGNMGRVYTSKHSSTPNEGWGTNYGSIQSPGNDPYVITVGATKSMSNFNRSDDRIATYSSRGPSRIDLVLKPDLIAPGNQVLSTMTKSSYLWQKHSGTNGHYASIFAQLLGYQAHYYVLSGTSMAAPVVAGAAAMMLTANPNLGPDTVKARLMVSADKWTEPDGTGDACTYGAGYLNVKRALACTTVANRYAVSPSMHVDAHGNVVINDQDFVGLNRAIWGSNVTDFRAIWGERAIWGSGVDLVDANRAIWGSSVWSDRAIWGSNVGQADLSTVAIKGE